MSDGKDGIGFFIMLFVGLFLFWVFTGGSEGGGLFKQTATSTPRYTTTQQQTISVPTAAPAPTLKEIESKLDQAHYDLAKLRDDVREARIWGVHSPYEDLVVFSGYGNARTDDPDREYLMLRAHSGNDGPVDISGWLIESVVTDNGATIPFGTRIAYTGTVNRSSPILLRPGELALVATGESPLGISFAENLCTGYLEQFQDFYPPLSRSCPRPIDDMEIFGRINLDNDNCYNYVKRLPYCQVVLNEALDAKPTLSNACLDFIRNELTYNSCIENHIFDPNFERNQWRVYLEYEDEELWRYEREIIRLVDREGRTVDVLEY